MIWVTWRQHRLECLIIIGVLILIALFLLINGLSMDHTSQQLGLASCLHQVNQRNCESIEYAFVNQYGFLSPIMIGVSILPPLLGLLIGAPLIARELEQGTHRLMWTQDISRMRWLNVKLALILSFSLVVVGILLAITIWWYQPVAQFQGTFASTSFDISGPVLLASALLAMSLGICAGTLTHRTVVAMFLTLILILSIRLPVEFYLRPNYQPAILETWSINENNPGPPPTQDWITEKGWINAQGEKTDRVHCSGTQAFQLQQCLIADGFTKNYLTYQPADRFWLFQWIETGIYLAFTVVALGATIWLVKRRLN